MVGKWLNIQINWPSGGSERWRSCRLAGRVAGVLQATFRAVQHHGQQVSSTCQTGAYQGRVAVHRNLFTSESVTEGHPDKICDAVSDAILDGMMAVDPNSRVAVETLVTTGQVHVAGEVSTNSYV